MRRVTIIIEEIGPGEAGSAKVSTESNAYGHGTVAGHISEVAQTAVKMWATVDPQSCEMRTTPPGRPKPAPRPGRPD
jgi:hypothetical protein